MELHVVITGDKDLSGQLYRQLHDAIRSGRLAADEQLPPSRLLAEQLGISRKTVSEVYARLTFEKLLVGRVGIGTFVAPQAAARVARAPARAAREPRGGREVARAGAAAAPSAGGRQRALRVHRRLAGHRAVPARRLAPLHAARAARERPHPRAVRPGRGPARAARGDRAPRRLRARGALHAAGGGRDQRRAAGAGAARARAGRARRHGRGRGSRLSAGAADPRAPTARAWSACRWTAKASSSTRFPPTRA